MYRFSRSIYRQLANEVAGTHPLDTAASRERVLRACETVMERLATDRLYFARPERSLFDQIRIFFPLRAQPRVRLVIAHHVRAASAFVDEYARAGVTFDGSPLRCNANTRKGTACQRTPYPGSRYCPSHRHLADDGEPAGHVVAT